MSKANEEDSRLVVGRMVVKSKNVRIPSHFALRRETVPGTQKAREMRFYLADFHARHFRACKTDSHETLGTDSKHNDERRLIHT
jgi:hypothetical protein